MVSGSRGFSFPSSSASSSLIFFYEEFPHSEVRRLWALLWSGPLSLLLWVCVFFCGPLFATGTSSGADGRVSRLRSTSPTAIVFRIPSFLCTCSAESQRTGAVGRVSRPRSSTWTYSLFCISSISLFSRVCRSRVAPLCFPFKFSSGVVRRSTCVVRLVSVSQLSWSGQVGRLPSCVQVIGLSQTRGLVVLDVASSATGYAVHALKDNLVFTLLNREIWIPVGLVVPRWSSFGTAFVDAGAGCPLRSRAERPVPNSWAGCP